MLEGLQSSLLGRCEYAGFYSPWHREIFPALPVEQMEFCALRE